MEQTVFFLVWVFCSFLFCSLFPLFVPFRKTKQIDNFQFLWAFKTFFLCCVAEKNTKLMTNERNHFAKPLLKLILFRHRQENKLAIEKKNTTDENSASTKDNDSKVQRYCVDHTSSSSCTTTTTISTTSTTSSRLTSEQTEMWIYDSSLNQIQHTKHTHLGQKKTYTIFLNRI